MARPAIQVSHTAVELKPSPINAAWIKGGDPAARKAILSRSRDGTACTLVWDCAPGAFEWHYDTDETIHILDGSVGPGDVVFFPAGAVVHWTVLTHVRKLAFFRRTLPTPIGFLTRVLAKCKALIGSAGIPNPGGLVDAPAVATVASNGQVQPAGAA